MAITATALAWIAVGASVLAAATSATAAGISSYQQNQQAAYQQAVYERNKQIVEQQTQAEMKLRAEEGRRQRASAMAKMGATGLSINQGNFMDLIGQQAADQELDVLKARYEGDMQIFNLNAKIGELATTKQNVGLNTALTGIGSAAQSTAKLASSGTLNSLVKSGGNLSTNKVSGGIYGDNITFA